MLSRCLLLYWSISTFLAALFGTFAFGTADWVAAAGPKVTEQGFSSIRLGLAYVCYDALDGTTSCGRYGRGIEDIPTLSWRVATFFFALGLALSWGTFFASLLIPCVGRMARWTTSTFVVASELCASRYCLLVRSHVTFARYPLCASCSYLRRRLCRPQP